MVRFALYSRTYCHLCEEMLAGLRALGDEFVFAVEVFDVDADPVLLEKYDELVPLLEGRKGNGEAERLCHYFLDVPKVRAFLSGCTALQK